MPDYADRRAGSHQAPPPGPSKPLATTGKQTLVEQIAVPAAVQRSANLPSGNQDEASVHAAAPRGIATPASPLPHSESIQRLFGRHDISQVQAHRGPEAADAARHGRRGVRHRQPCRARRSHRSAHGRSRSRARGSTAWRSAAQGRGRRCRRCVRAPCRRRGGSGRRRALRRGSARWRHEWRHERRDARGSAPGRPGRRKDPGEPG